MSYWIAGAATVGALTDRKKPLRGALMGAGLGAGGGALMGAGGMGGLMGGGAASGGAAGGGLLSGTAAGAASAAPTAGFGLGQPLVTGSLGSSTAAGASSPGLLSSINATLSQYKPMMDAASTGLSMSGAMNQEQQPPMEAPEVQQAQGGSQVMAGLASQGGSAKLQSDAAERERRKQMIRGYA
mgnify:CR=1 FL=1